MRLLLLDNYDSFTYNLLHLIEKVSDYQVDVIKNDRIQLEQINAYHKIVLSPGPGLPSHAGIMPQLLRYYASSKPIFGVCLGLQAIGERFNSPLKNLHQVFHGMATPIHVNSTDPLFKNCPESFHVGRYHSWVIDENQLSDDLVITARDEHQLIMALRHKTYDVCGVQFHPESILSEYGEVIMRNWLNN